MIAQITKKRSDSSSSESSQGGRWRNEKLVNRARRVVPLGATLVDDKTALSVSLAEQVSLKAMSIESTYLKRPGGLAISYKGQMGLVRGRQLHPTPDRTPDQKDQHARKRQRVTFQTSCYEVTPFTALHNIVNEQGEVFQHVKVSFSDPSPRETILAFPEGGRELSVNDQVEICPEDTATGTPALEWESVDVTQGNQISDATHVLTPKQYSFEKVPDAFVPQTGQKIGIAVLRNFGIDASDTGAPLDQGELEQYFGRVNNVCVLTGQVGAVHGRAFEHSINTFRGCSGAIVFLLDRQDQSHGHAMEHAGKAIGVHVGGKPIGAAGERANLAFRI